MAFQDYFGTPIAYDPTQDKLVADAVFTVHAMDDASFTTPLPVVEPGSGAAITELRSSSIGVLPDFRVTGDPAQVLIKSGSFITALTSVYGAVMNAGLDPETVQTAIDARAEAVGARDVAVTAADEAVAAAAGAEGAAATTTQAMTGAPIALPDSLFAGGRFVQGRFVPERGSETLSVSSERPWRVSPGGHPIFERASTNLYTPAAVGFDVGGKVGVVGSGGALPTGMTRSTAVPWEVLAVDAESLTVKVSGTLGAPGAAEYVSLNFRVFGDGGYGIDGGVVTAFDVEMLDWTGEVTQVTFPSRIREGGSLLSTAPIPINTFYKDSIELGVQRVSAHVTLTAAQYLQQDMTVFATGAFSLTVRISRMKAEQAVGNADCTAYSRRPTLPQTLTIGVPADGTYKVLIASEGSGRVESLTSVGRVISVPAPAVGSEAVVGVWLFSDTVSARDMSDVFDYLHPAELASMESRNAYLHYSWEGDEWTPGTQRRVYLSSPPRTAVTGTGTPPMGERASYGFATALNRRSLERFEIRAGDVTSGEETTNRVRSELYSSDNPDQIHPLGQVVWVSYWLNIRQPHASTNMIVGQWHAPADLRINGTAIGPTMSVMVEPGRGTQEEGDKLRIWAMGSTHYLAAGNNSIPGETPDSLATQTMFLDNMPYEYGTWTHLVIRAKLTGDATGELQWWRDGREVVNETGLLFGWNAYAGNYFQRGIYAYKIPLLYGRTLNQAVMYSRLHVSDESLLSHVTNPPPRV